MKYTEKQYIEDFLDYDNIKLTEKALEQALDTRKFEIELYWKRATYFWAFIGVTFAGFLAVKTGKNIDKIIQQDLSVLLSCIGFVFSYAWFCVNKGSKKWQENWEVHVAKLEDCVQGPLHKVVFDRPKSNYLMGPDSFSVSKINQLISFYIILVWLFLIKYSLPPFDFESSIHWQYTIEVLLSFLACLFFQFLCRSSNSKPEFEMRKTNCEKEKMKMNKKRIFLIVLCSFFPVIFAYISHITKDWTWFSRSGALIIIVAISLEYWKTIITKKVDNMPFFGDQEGHTSVRIAAVAVLIGTLIWGFGDLVNTFYK